jgi:hypothetical protein
MPGGDSVELRPPSRSAGFGPLEWGQNGQRGLTMLRPTARLMRVFAPASLIFAAPVIQKK